MPSILLIVGFSIAKIESFRPTAELRWFTILGVVFLRLVFVPAVIFASLLSIGDFLDRTAKFVVLLQAATPGNAVLLILSVNSCEREMQLLVFYTYLCSLVTLPCWLMAQIAVTAE